MSRLTIIVVPIILFAMIVGIYLRNQSSDRFTDDDEGVIIYGNNRQIIYEYYFEDTNFTIFTKDSIASECLNYASGWLNHTEQPDRVAKMECYNKTKKLYYVLNQLAIYRLQHILKMQDQCQHRQNS